MSTKEQRIVAANQTLAIFENGSYVIDGKTIDIFTIHQHTMASTILYTPDTLDQIKIDAPIKSKKTIYQLKNLPVVTALSQLSKDGKSNIAILNFASAKNPGGGFLNGAQAQEESLAMCSNLYLTQIKNNKYYEANRSCSSMLYTDYMIYSKDIVFIREDVHNLFNAPITASVLTAPAVNMGAYLASGNSDIEYAYKIMKNRMRKILMVLAEQKNTVLILGAFGCGVFRNDPYIVATFFSQLLKDEGFGAYFDEIVFAVFDSTKSQNVFHGFKKGLCCE